VVVEQAKLSKRKAQAAATREQLLRAARDVFAARGYQATTVAAITQAADTAHGTFYLYFRNKEDAFARVVDALALEIYERTWPSSTPQPGEDLIGRTVRAFLEMFAGHPGIWRCLLEGAFTNPSIEVMWRDLRAGFVMRTARWLEEMQALGLVREIDPVLAANAVGGMVEWAATTQFVLRMPPAGDASMEDTAAVLSDLVRHALSPQPWPGDRSTG
jgi:AcrR family transcriptional regulator